MKTRKISIKAARKFPREIRFAATPIALAAAEDEGGVPRFEGVAYTGDLLHCGWGLPVVVNLAGVRAPTKARPVLLNHDPAQPVGHFEPGGYANDGKEMRIAGVLSGGNAFSEQVIAAAKNGFPWQQSIGADGLKVTEIAPDVEVEINGRSFMGPLLIVDESELKEVSFVVLGADDATSATVAASRRRISGMNFNDYCKSLGYDPENLSEAERAALEKAYAASGEVEAKDGDKGGKDDGEEDKDKDVEASAKKVMLRLERTARESERSLVCSREKYAGLKNAAAILAQANREDWGKQHLINKLELEHILASRAEHPGLPLRRDAAFGIEAIRAGVMMKFGVKSATLERIFKSEILEAGRKHRGIGIKGLIQACCVHEGVSAPMLYDADEAFVKAAFSTASFPKILSDSMNKLAFDAYETAVFISKALCRKLSVNDFKVNTGVMLTHGVEWEKLGPDGQIKSIDVGKEATFTYSVETVAGMVTFTRQMLRNDDLGLFQDFASKLGFDAAYTEEMNFFRLFMGNTGNYISSGNNNLITNPLSIDGISAAVTKLREQVNDVGVAMNLTPAILLVPPALEPYAKQIYASMEVRPAADSTGKAMPVANIYKGEFNPVVSPLLSNAKFGNKADLDKCWYLLPDPARAAAFGRAYLDGNESPTIEEVDVEPNRLGTSFRGYFDFGHCQIDRRCIVKSDGTGA